MSRSITQTSSSGSAVAAGSSVVAPVFTTTGFNAGDYVYTTPTGVGTRATGNAYIGLDTYYSGTLFGNAGIQTSAFRTVSYGPSIDQGLYTGSTRTLGQAIIAANTVKAVSQSANRTCTLTNGNVVLMYSSGANLYFKVIDPTGATVVAETTLTTTLQSTGVGAFGCCGLLNGNIQFAYKTQANQTATYAHTLVQYTAAGAVAIAAANSGGYFAQFDAFCLAALSGGGFVMTGVNGNNTATNTPVWMTFNSTQGTAGGGTGYAGVGIGNAASYSSCIGLPASYGTNIWVYLSQNTNQISNGSDYAVLAVYSGSSAVANAQTNGQLGGPNGYTFNIALLSDGTIICPIWNGNIYAQRFTYTKATNTTGSLTIGTQAYSGCNHSSCTFMPLGDGLTTLIVGQTGNTISSNTYSSTNAYTALTTIGSSTAATQADAGQFCAASFGNGTVSSFYKAITTNYPSEICTVTVAATNGVTTLTGTSYLPSGGYYLLGVAATNASANTTGQVIMNGTAQLGSTYPTVTSPIYYSYQTTASQPIFGQRGSVAGTTVTLKGLEA